MGMWSRLQPAMLLWECRFLGTLPFFLALVGLDEGVAAHVVEDVFERREVPDVVVPLDGHVVSRVRVVREGAVQDGGDVVLEVEVLGAGVLGDDAAGRDGVDQEGLGPDVEGLGAEVESPLQFEEELLELGVLVGLGVAGHFPEVSLPRVVAQHDFRVATQQVLAGVAREGHDDVRGRIGRRIRIVRLGFVDLAEERLRSDAQDLVRRVFPDVRRRHFLVAHDVQGVPVQVHVHHLLREPHRRRALPVHALPRLGDRRPARRPVEHARPRRVPALQPRVVRARRRRRQQQRGRHESSSSSSPRRPARRHPFFFFFFARRSLFFLQQVTRPFERPPLRSHTSTTTPLSVALCHTHPAGLAREKDDASLLRHHCGNPMGFFLIA
mmetsp:Transcript_25892/g.79699  ORF Transcript_25892/g.79699 Transcript_25892/m.79699 type:complete len:382 (+) Transcript_25892:57-1202(+)